MRPSLAEALHSSRGGTRVEELIAASAVPPVTTATTGRSSLSSLSDFLERPYPKAYFLDLIGQDQTVMVYGPPGTGKSLFVIRLIADLLEGRDLGGFRFKGDGRETVLYITTEGEHGIAKRFRAAQKVYGLSDGAIDRLKLNNVSVVALRDDDDGPKTIGELVFEACEAFGRSPSLIVLDVFSGLIPGRDENNTGDMVAVMQELSRIKREHPGTSVIFVHHPSKAGENPRGSSSLEGAADMIIRLAPGKDGNPGTIECKKAKDSEMFAPWHFSISGVEVGIDADGDPVWSAVMQWTDAPESSARQNPRERVWEALNHFWNSGETPTQAMVMEYTGLRKSAVSDWMRALMGQGVVQAQGRGGKGEPLRYEQVKL